MGLSPAERQARYKAKKYAEWQSLPPVLCACGCGTPIPPINKKGQSARYTHGHNPGNEVTRFQTGQVSWNKGGRAPWATRTHQGKKIPPEQLAQRTATRLERNSGTYQIKRGWKHDPETLERMKVANRAKALCGPDNPFYGKKHPKETRKRISAALSGPNNPGWNGGCSSLPYGPEFTRKFRRLIRQRDKYTCRRCGKTQKEVGRTLQVHHVDHNKTNNDPTNLVTVCGSCNVWLSYHRSEPFTPLPIA